MAVAAVVSAGAILAPPAMGQDEAAVERPPEFQGHKSERKNMRLVGHHDLDGRSAYQPLSKKNPFNDQWYTYVGHHAGEAVNSLTGKMEDNGTSIVRTTNPRRPRLVAHIPPTDPPGEANQRQAQMVRICNGEDLPDPEGQTGDDPRDDKVYLLRANGNVSHEIWDVTRPRNPQLLTTVVDNLNGTHKSEWHCESGLGYLVSGVEGWATNRMTQLFDLSDPEAPVHIRDFGLPGQEPGGNDPDSPYSTHGGLQIGNRFYNGMGTSRSGVYEIWDVEALRTGGTDPATADEALVVRRFLPRFMGAHTTFPVLDIPVKADEDFFWDTRDILVVSNEAIANECREAHQQVFFVDITDERNPVGISNYKVNESEGNFCQRGGRFGNHSSNENMTDDFYGKIVFFAYFNAGIRAVDIRDPFNPKEVGKYIPATTKNTAERCVDTNGDAAGGQRCKIAIQTNNLETDDRNYIHAVDRANTGLHILAVTGQARRIMRQNVRPNEDDNTPTLEEVAG